MPSNQQIHLDNRPSGEASLSNFKLVSSSTPALLKDEVLVRHHFLSLDPYMRGRMNDSKSYAAPQALGQVMGGGTAGEVVESRSAKFQAGDKVVGMGGWQQYSVVNAEQAGALRKVDVTHVPLSHYLGAVGMPGVTAWYGLVKILEPQAGQTVAVSAATGAVGSAFAALAKARGCRVVGIAGGPEKCGYAIRELGFDACIDYKLHTDAESLSEALKQDCPDGDGQPVPLANPALILRSRLRVQGFIVSEHPDVWPEALKELGTLVGSGKLRPRESIAQGLAAAPEAFLGLLKGRNFGKQLVKLI
jgi:NADPH-dependent curcumin reductase CurA